MVSLDLAKKARELILTNKPARLYKTIIREIPRVSAIYDIEHLGNKALRKQIRSHFYHNAHIKDQRVIDVLIELGYIDLEDTLLQHKQKIHLMLLLEHPPGTDVNSKRLKADSSEEEQFTRLM